MANKKFLVNLDLNGNQLINASWEILSTAPTSPFLGQTYFDSTLKVARTWNGSEWVSVASASELSKVKSDLSSLTTVVAENKITAADTSVVVTPGSTKGDATTGTTVKINVKSGSNDLKVDASGVYVTPYTADEVTITKTGNQFKVKDGVFDANGAANTALNEAKSYADTQDETNLATAKGYTDTEVGKAKAMLPSFVEGNGIVINTAVEESTGKKTYTISADSSVFQFRGSVAPQDGLTPSQVLDAQYGEGKKYAVKDLGDAWAYGAESTGHVIYAWDGDEWVLIGSAEGVSGVDTSKTAEGVKLTHAGSIVGIDTSDLGTKLSEMAAATAKVASDLATETSNRTSGDATTLSSAKTYADAITVNGKAQSNQAITVLGSDVAVSGTDTRKVDVAIKEAQDAADAAQSTADTNKTTIDNYTVNGKKISTNPVLAGSDIKVTGYTKAESVANVAAADTVNVAIGKVEKKADKGIADAAQALVDAKAYTDSSIRTAVGAGVHTYVTTVSSGNSFTIPKATHDCGHDPIVQCYCDGSLVEVVVSINASGDVTVEWNGTLPSALKIKLVGNPT